MYFSLYRGTYTLRIGTNMNVIIVSANVGLIWLIFHGELIWQVRLVLQGGKVGEIDQFS